MFCDRENVYPRPSPYFKWTKMWLQNYNVWQQLGDNFEPNVTYWQLTNSFTTIAMIFFVKAGVPFNL